MTSTSTSNDKPTHKPAPIDIPSKPIRIKLTEDIDFFELFKRIEVKFATCYLLESLGKKVISHVITPLALILL